MRSRRKRLIIHWLVVAVPLALTCATATGETLEPVQDSTLILQHPDNNYGPSGGFDVGYYVGTGTEERALIQFDLAGVQGPVSGATLTLCIMADYNSSSHLEAELHRLTQSWTENGVTWNTYDGVNPWATPGGDYDPAVITTVNVGSTIGTCHPFNITDIVQQWVDGTHPNHGLLVMSPGYVASNWTAFGSREHADPGMRPYLELDGPFFADGFESGDTSGW